MFSKVTNNFSNTEIFSVKSYIFSVNSPCNVSFIHVKMIIFANDNP